LILFGIDGNFNNFQYEREITTIRIRVRLTQG
jgi:hypothetical protein